MSSLFIFVLNMTTPSFGCWGLCLPTYTEPYSSTEPGPLQMTPCRCQGSGDVHVHRRGCIFMRGLSSDPCLLQPLTLFIPMCYWLMSDAPLMNSLNAHDEKVKAGCFLLLLFILLRAGWHLEVQGRYPPSDINKEKSASAPLVWILTSTTWCNTCSSEL